MMASKFQREWLVNDKLLYLVALTTSLLLSFWLSYRETVINPDGICYLLSAQTVGTSSIKEVMHLCPQSQWPFYSVLIYAVTQLSHFSYSTSAYLLNAFFSLLSVTAFIFIVRELGGTRRVLWLAAAAILLNHEFISMREYIIRDHGFWAFYLCSIYLLIRYFRKPDSKLGLAWSASLLVATLFRIEGAIFLLTMPLLAFLDLRVSFRQRLNAFLLLNIPTIMMGIGIVAWLLLHPQQSMTQLGRFSEIINQVQHGFSMLADRYASSKAALVQHILTSDSESDAGAVLLFVWVAWYLLNVMTALSWVYGVLVIYAWVGRVARFPTNGALVVFGYLGMNVIITLSFLAEHLFLSKRYLIALTLVLMLWVPFALDYLIRQWPGFRHRVALALAALFIFIGTVGGIIDFGYSKSYIHEAGDWIADNVPANASFYANDFQLLYYSQHFGTGIFKVLPGYINIKTIANGQWKQYDYVALRVGKQEEGDTAAVLSELNGQPIQVFSNKRGDKVVIYKKVMSPNVL